MKTRVTIWHITALVLAVYTLITPFAFYPTLADKGPSWLGIDVSWKMTINYALMKGFVWGKDIIFTYGPLGYLTTRIGWGISQWQFLLFDIFWVFNFFMIFKDYLENSVNKYLSVLILFCVVLLLFPFPTSTMSWIMMFFIFYWLYKTLDNSSYLYYLVLATLVTLSFFMKLNTGLTGLFFLLGQLVVKLLYKRIKITRAIIFLAMPVIMIVLAGKLLNVYLPGYIKGTIEVIKGYNDLLYLNEHHTWLEVLIQIIYYSLFVVLVLHAIVCIRRKKYDHMYFVLISIVYLFLLKKQATFRNDVSHLKEFFPSAPLILIYGSLLYFKDVQRYYLVYTLLIIVLSMSLPRGRDFSQIAQHRLATLPNYLSGFHHYDRQAYMNQETKRYIPPRVLQKIGNSPVDIFPWDIAYLLENKLNYSPRPAFQSQILTPYLEEANYNHYLYHAPAFVIYDYDDMDGRYPFEDILMHLFIVRNYSLADTFYSNEQLRLVLQKDSITRPIRLQEKDSETAGINIPIAINSADVIKVYAEYNTIGRLESIFGMPPNIDLVYTTQDGKVYTYRTSPEVLKGGIYTGEILRNTGDIIDLLAHRTEKGKKLKLITLKSDPTYFSQIKVVRYTLIN